MPPFALQINPDSRIWDAVKKLRGTESYRYRVGKYRIVYTIDDAAHSIEIVGVGHRREVYR